MASFSAKKSVTLKIVYNKKKIQMFGMNIQKKIQMFGMNIHLFHLVRRENVYFMTHETDLCIFWLHSMK